MGENRAGFTYFKKIAGISLPLLIVGLLVSIVTFFGFYAYWDRGYFWIDEVFSLWVTDKSHSVWAMQTQLLTNETNPPLHYWLLYGFRQLIADPRSAGHALNFVVMALSVSFMVWLPWRAGRPGLGLLLGIVFLMSSGTMYFMQDIRNGFTAMALCGVAIALSGTVRLKGEATRSDLILAAGVGLLAGISHVYGALLVGCLSAAVIVDSMLKRSRSQAVFGLVLGTTCSLSFAAWFAGLWISTGGHLGSIAWLAGLPPLVGFELVWSSYFGPVWAWPMIALGVALALTAAAFRRAAIILAICAAMVAVIPAVISLKTPIVFFRYFLILGPALHLLLAVAIYELIQNYSGAQRPGRLAGLAVLGGSIAVALPVVTGVFDAAALLAENPWWMGVDRVRAEAGHCPSHIIRADLSENPGPATRWGFEYLIRGTGLKVEDAAQSPKDVSDIDCSVVGWAEHMVRSGAGSAPGVPTEADALKLMNLTNSKHVPLKVERHPFGFVIYKAKN